MKGNITRRGKNSFRLKFDAGIDANGKRKIQYHTFRGSKREAEDKLTELMASVGNGSYVEPSKIMVADFVRGLHRSMASVRQDFSGYGGTLS